MVNPDRRGAGIYRKLTESLVDECKNQRIDVLYGFPAPKARDLFIRYTGAKELVHVPRFVRVQHPLRVLTIKLPF